jgi:hypothetical protein
MAGTETPA